MADIRVRKGLDHAWRNVIANGADDGRLVTTSFEDAAGRGERARSPPICRRCLPTASAAPGSRASTRTRTRRLARAAQGHVISTSGTASGKSLSFNLPVLETLALDPKSRALYLYPTKALAQDQARKLSALELPFLRHAIYDGDTPREDRPGLRRRSNLILTNPDMVNVGLLPHHQGWGDFMANLRWIVVDEAHTYRGVFGSHVANVLRRLRRVARLYRSEPTFLLASATIANPGELAERLVGEPVSVVASDGAPKAGRRIVIWNPPVIDERTQRRRSTLSEGAELLADLVAEGMRTICFLRSRKGIELILRFAKLRLEERGRADLAARIAPYRAGYTPQQRREIEHRLVAGDLLGVVATDALELGIDIGELDASICVTFPGTVASLRQMWGRAGRRTEGLAVYVAGEDALDQFFCRHPDEFLERPVEAAILDHSNPHIQTGHILAAAHEAPLGGGAKPAGRRGRRDPRRRLARARRRPGRGRRASPGTRRALRAARPGLRGGAHLAALGVARLRRRRRLEPRARCSARSRPSARSRRSTPARSTSTSGARTRCASSTSNRAARSSIPSTATGTRSRRRRPTSTSTRSAARRTRRGCTRGVELYTGEVSVSEQVIAYQRKTVKDQEVIDLVALNLPEQSFSTRALWYVLPDELAGPEALPPEVQLGALHAAEHSQIAVLPLLAMCDRWDIGGLSTNVHFQTGRPTIFIYDGHPGGVGIAERGFERFGELVGNALRLVSECPCERGCPSCVQSPKCGNLNEPLHKAGAIELMSGILGRTPAPSTAPR